MAHSHLIVGAADGSAAPTIRRIGFADLKDALSQGADDFLAMPTHAIFLCVIYPLIGLIAARCTRPIVAEGRIHTPVHAAAAIAAGAYAVCVGTAITHPATITSWFARSLAEARP